MIYLILLFIHKHMYKLRKKKKNKMHKTLHTQKQSLDLKYVGILKKQWNI